MYCLVYVSCACATFNQQALGELLRKSRDANAARDVTGILVHFGGNFMQALEGEKDAVLGLYRKIARDQRHNQVRTIIELPIVQRMFPDWSMAFKETRE